MGVLRIFSLLIVLAMISRCTQPTNPPQEDSPTVSPGSVAYATNFLREFDTTLTVLKNEQGRVIVSPRYQAKVFASGIGGDNAPVRGWINYEEIAKDTIVDHMNAYGGENRYWLGPEGGQYSVFFAPGDDFDFANWQTPPAIDSESWSVTEREPTSISMAKEARLKNYTGTVLDLRMERTVNLLSRSATREALPAGLASYPSLAYRTDNGVVNTGTETWTAEGGAVSIWILDMFPPGENTVIVIPYREQGEGEIVRSDYFGQVPADRLREKDGVVLFRADGKQRGKIGLPPGRATGTAGSVDLSSGRITLVQYDMDSTASYPRQEWKLHDEPYTGDAVNAYNDGPLEDGSQMGPFFEIESVSPAAFLAPGERLTHAHTIIHLDVPPAELDDAVSELFGTDLQTIKKFLQP